MTTTADRLYELLPAIHRIRDAEQGYPLRELLAVIAEQVAAMEENLEQLYDDQFIETCAPWVAPYIGDLIGYRTLHGVAPNVASPRADVANTIRYRRRKGTASMLEQLAHDVTGWPTRAVEFFQLLGWTQNMNHLRTHAHYAPDLRNRERLHWRDTAFDTIAHTVDVRRISTGAARHNIPNIGLYLWRVRAFPLTRSQAVVDSDIGGGLRFRFNPLGVDMALYNTPETEEEISHLAEPRNVPMPLARRWLKAHLDDYYGPGKSLWLELDGNPPQLITRNNIRICDLSDIKDGGGNVIAWAHQPIAGSGLAAIDPILGRIAFADAPAATPLVNFHYGYTIAIGGGEYERGDPAVPVTPLQSVQGGTALQPALNAVQNGGTVKVLDSRRYVETPSITVNAGKTVVLRAINGVRPLLAASSDITLTLGAEATLILDGWVINGGTLMMAAFPDTKPRYLILRDCTLVPGPRNKGDGSPPQADDPGLVVNHAFAKVELERCITAPVHIAADAKVSLRECIVDATAQSLVAFRGPGANSLAEGAELTLESCTVIGKVHTRQLTLASDCLFVAALTNGSDPWKAPLWAERRQQGCVRFSYIPPGSHTPARYHCQPEGEEPQIWPQFTSLRYGDPGYCQLLQSTSDKIRRGAHDESEMGVLHGLYQPQRETNLHVRLEEYLRFGLEAGLIYGS
ncbi:hypothetical protein [Candidatus Nitrotoga sp. M5]|uniref:hypothetical protein n=1 Tax=Candidatus Nitrotoga sp. M5 TaxID=2890409 RepID=UPI001EF57315|nr:hypothetical protein [Candidatus Nitrotoga sp. M5]CAH1388067.1 conserved hypothetical protein [Candidatus Nitrotoga sp. M5]